MVKQLFSKSYEPLDGHDGLMIGQAMTEALVAQGSTMFDKGQVFARQKASALRGVAIMYDIGRPMHFGVVEYADFTRNCHVVADLQVSSNKPVQVIDDLVHQMLSQRLIDGSAMDVNRLRADAQDLYEQADNRSGMVHALLDRGAAAKGVNDTKERLNFVQGPRTLDDTKVVIATAKALHASMLDMYGQAGHVGELAFYRGPGAAGYAVLPYARENEAGVTFVEATKMGAQGSLKEVLHMGLPAQVVGDDVRRFVWLDRLVSRVAGRNQLYTGEQKGKLLARMGEHNHVRFLYVHSAMKDRQMVI